MRKVLDALLILALMGTSPAVCRLGAQAPPNLPTEAANPPRNDVWIWVEHPLGPVPRAPITIRFWAFRCGGTIKAVRPSVAGLLYANPFLAETAGNTLTSDQPRPDIVAAMASKCAAIPLNIGYTLTWDLRAIPTGSYSLDLEVTDDLGRKTKLRQTRGSFTVQ